MVQEAIVLYSVLGFLAVRFLLAAAALAPYGVRRISLQTLAVGASVGFALALGYLFQTTATRLALLIVSSGLTLAGGALVEQHGGQLKVTSERGGGTYARIRLPLRNRAVHRPDGTAKPFAILVCGGLKYSGRQSYRDAARAGKGWDVKRYVSSTHQSGIVTHKGEG